MDEKELDKIFADEQVINRVQMIRQWGETNEIYKLINHLVKEYTSQTNVQELKIHWTKEDGFIFNEAKFSL